MRNRYILIVIVLLGLTSCTTQEMAKLERQLGVRNGFYQKQIKQERLAKKRAIKQAKKYHYKIIGEHINKFKKRYGLTQYDLIWLPDKSWKYTSNDHSINGKGNMRVVNEGLETSRIRGTFQDGRLVSNVDIYMKKVKCLDWGLVFCKKNLKDDYTKNNVPPHQLKYVVPHAIATVRKSVNAQQRHRNSIQYGKKYVGQKVCIRGKTALGLISAKVTAYVERVSGSRIQLRITDTSTSVNYKGTPLKQNTIIWDNHSNWGTCN